MKPIAFSGTFTALVTPFRAGAEEVDFEALHALVEAQIAGGVVGLVPCGTTGETPTLSAEEQLRVIRAVVQVAAGRVPVIAGTGSNHTAASIAASRAALEVGADGVMVMMPYYNKPSPAGMKAHCVAVARAVDAPVVLYNIPGRTVVDLAADTTEAICEAAPNVVALKDATGNVVRCQEVKRRLGDRLAVMSGDDGLVLGMVATGAAGVISVSSNVIPDRVSAVTDELSQGNFAAARSLHLELLPFHRAMFAEPNPAPAKAGLAMRGMMAPDVRLPLVPATDATRATVREELSRLGVL
ncbi:MAG: 4-hydroxy-tetrahydrodipicolinate synthase [Myxococcota bacterium]